MSDPIPFPRRPRFALYIAQRPSTLRWYMFGSPCPDRVTEADLLHLDGSFYSQAEAIAAADRTHRLTGLPIITEPLQLRGKRGAAG
jgi:hypothetical protein